MTKDKFPVMLASPMKEIGRINFPCKAQIKMDGMRAMIIKRDGVVTVYSRNGNKMIKLDEHFAPILKGMDNVVLDGELTVVKDIGSDVVSEILDRKAGNGICHKAVESVSTISDEEVSRIRITLWDMISLKGFDEGLDPVSYNTRLGALLFMKKNKLFNVVGTYHVKSLKEAQELFQKMLGRGEEGIILKNDKHPWEAKRSKQIVKMKEVLEMDLKIIGFAEGAGKNSGMCGAIQCENKDGTIKVDVGTGMDDAKRIEIWERQEELIGTIISIKHNGVITRKGSETKSLFLPVFVELRPDKEESD